MVRLNILIDRRSNVPMRNVMYESDNIEEQRELERDSDSQVDMWCSVALVFLAWAVAMHWLMGL